MSRSECPFKYESKRLNPDGIDALSKKDYLLYDNNIVGFNNPTHVEKYDSCRIMNDRCDNECVGESVCPIMKK